MEVIFFEDPACSWCWAFQPVQTAFVFEFGESVSWRAVMGGLRDHPVPDISLVKRHWLTAGSVSGMPFNDAVWDAHVLQTTFVACRAVKAVSLRCRDAGNRLLRRLREAFYTECTPIDDLEKVFDLASELGIDVEDMLDQISSGRAEALFELDRRDADGTGFGFPTTVVHRHAMDEPTVLQGSVPYADLVHALHAAGVPHSRRRRFRDTAEDWERLFSIHPRLTRAEVEAVTAMEADELDARLAGLGIRSNGALLSRDAGPDAEPEAMSDDPTVLESTPPESAPDEPAADHPEPGEHERGELKPDEPEPDEPGADEPEESESDEPSAASPAEVVVELAVER